MRTINDLQRNVASRMRHRLARRNGRFASDETGSLTIFSLFLFIMLLFIAGMAVDMVHQERQRVALQNTLDTAVLAASSMTQQIDATTLVHEYVSKAGFDPNKVSVTPVDVYSGNGTGLTSRSVKVASTASTDTIFMEMLGVSELHSPVGGSAIEASENIEISLVLDISGSMAWASADATKTKLDALKEAANEFVDVIFATNDPEHVSINIVPYNQQVYVPDEIMNRLTMNGSTAVISPVPSYPGSLASYQTEDPNAPCLSFDAADFGTLSLGASGGFDRASAFLADNYYWGLGSEVQQAYDTPYEWARWCGNYFTRVMPLSNNQTALKTHINSMVATGATAINVGLNWGLGLLDNSFKSIADDMRTNNLLSSDTTGRPFNYNSPGVQKYVILMTDGANTNQFDLKAEFQNGPTRAWYSPSMGATSKYEGYYVLMPDNAVDQRWYRPMSPTDTTDDVYVTEASLPADAVQLDYHELYQRFGYQSAARFLFENSDATAYMAHNDVYEDNGGWGVADTRLKQLCDLARNNNQVKIFTVAFEAPTAGETVLQDCAHAPGFYFDVDGTDIKSAFRSIAGQIALLRLAE